MLSIISLGQEALSRTLSVNAGRPAPQARDVGHELYIHFLLFSHSSLPDQMRPSGQRLRVFRPASREKQEH